MKNIVKWSGFVVFMLLSQNNFAQQKRSAKPTLFSRFPSTIPCTPNQLNKLFEVQQGQNIKLELPGKLTLDGIVKNKTTKYGKIETMTVQLPAFENILFAVTRSIDENNEAIYTAHLFNSNYADGYQLKRNNKTYQFEKIETEKILPACNH